jgi:hypothetical protein
MYSPWGSVQHQKSYDKGIVNVSTAGHGGVMIKIDVAEKFLSKEAIALGTRYRDYITYEEDCAFAIPFFELKHLWSKMYNNKSNEEIELSLMMSLSTWYADYLISRGITPLKEQYQYYLDDKKDMEMRKNKDGNLIVAAWGSWKTNIEGVVLVVTADQKYHHVTQDSYDKRTERGRFNLLSNCEVLANDIAESA